MPPATLASILRHIRSHARIEPSPARPPGGGRLRAALALFTLAVGPGLSGCILGSERPDLNLDMSATYRAAPRGAADAAVPAVDWWRGFRSSELTSLMDAAQVYNLDIAVAVAEIVQADAQVGVSGAPLLPSVTGTASAERQHVGSQSATTGTSVAGGSTFSQFSTGLTASYMLDFWGKNRATIYAAEENATVARYNREVVTLTTIVTVANTYFQILAAQDQLRVTRHDLAAAERILTLIRNQFNGGIASLFTPGAWFYTLTASLTQRLFDGFLLESQLKLAKGVQLQDLQAYRKAVLSAFADVEKALIALQNFTLQERLQSDVVAASRKA